MTPRQQRRRHAQVLALGICKAAVSRPDGEQFAQFAKDAVALELSRCQKWQRAAWCRVERLRDQRVADEETRAQLRSQLATLEKLGGRELRMIRAEAEMDALALRRMSAEADLLAAEEDFREACAEIVMLQEALEVIDVIGSFEPGELTTVTLADIEEAFP